MWTWDDIHDPRVIAAMGRVPRARFVPLDSRAQAAEDRPLPIGCGQTISQPYIVAFMSQALELTGADRVLEIGAGSGYQSAILAELVAEVYAVERLASLAAVARTTLEDLGYRNIHLRVGDGRTGWPEAAPFDRILVAAAARETPPALVDQLRDGGLMAIPIGDSHQELHILRKEHGALRRLGAIAVRFVPLVEGPGGE